MTSPQAAGKIPPQYARAAGGTASVVQRNAAGNTLAHALGALGRLHFGSLQLAVGFGEAGRLHSLERRGAGPHPNNQREGFHARF